MNEVKLYAERDLMEMDRAGNHYCRHVDHMTREKLHSKSDIAAELGWRDMQIANLKEQLTATTNSLTNAQEALKSAGIEADTVQAGVMGLKAQRDALAAENAALKDINAWCKTEAFENMYREFKTAEAIGCPDVDCMHDAMLTAIMHAPLTPATDAYLNAVRAEGVDKAIEHLHNKFASTGHVGVPVMALEWLSAKLRAGNAGKDGSHE